MSPPVLAAVAEDVQRLKRLTRDVFRDLVDVKRRLRAVEELTGVGGAAGWPAQQSGHRVRGRWTTGLESVTRRVTHDLDLALEVPLRAALGEAVTVHAVAHGGTGSSLHLSRVAYRVRPTRSTRVMVVPCGAEGPDAGSTLNPAHGVALTPMAAAGSAVYRLAASCGRDEADGDGQGAQASTARRGPCSALAASLDVRLPIPGLEPWPGTVSGALFGAASSDGGGQGAAVGQLLLRPAPRLALALASSRLAPGRGHVAGAAAAAVVGPSLVTLSAWAARHSAKGWEWALAVAPSPPLAGSRGGGRPTWGAVVTQPWGGAPPAMEAFLQVPLGGDGPDGAASWSVTPGLVLTQGQPVEAQLRTHLSF